MLRSKNSLSILALTCLALDEITGQYNSNGNLSTFGAKSALNSADVQIPPNIDLFQEDSLNEEQSSRQLVINDGNPGFPFGFVLSESQCGKDIEMNGFGMRDSSNFVVSGIISSISTDCAYLQDSTKTVSGTIHNFVSSQSTSGLVTWYKWLMSSYEVFQGLTISSNNVLVIYHDSNYDSGNSQFRVLKLSISTGAWAAETVITKQSGGTSVTMSSVAFGQYFSLFRSQLTSTTYRNYVTFATTSVLSGGSTATPTGLIRFDDNFNVLYQRTLNYDQNGPLVYLQDMDFTSVYSVAFGYADQGTAYSAYNSDLLKLYLFNETSGETLDQKYMYAEGAETSFTNKQVYGVARFGTSGSNVFTAYNLLYPNAYYYDQLLQLAYVPVAASGSTFVFGSMSRTDTNMFCASPQLEVISTTSIVLTCVEKPVAFQNTLIPTQEYIVHVYFLTYGSSYSITKHYTIHRSYSPHGSFAHLLMRYYSPTTKSSAMYLAYNTPYHFTPSYPARIVFYKIDITNTEVFSAECGGSTSWPSGTHSTSYSWSTGALNSNGAGTKNTDPYYYYMITTQVLSGTNSGQVVVYDPSSTASSLTLLTPVRDTFISENSYYTSISASGSASYVPKVASTNFDSTNTQFVEKIIVGLESQVSFSASTTGCNTTPYVCTAITYPNSTLVNINTGSFTLTASATTPTNNQAVIGSFKINSATGLITEYAGSRTLKLTCSIDSGIETAHPFVRYNIVPAIKPYSQTATFTSSTQCSTPIFPIFLGHDGGNVQINFLGSEVYTGDTNLLMAGASNVKPYGTSSINQGFIGRMDSYGRPYWIYYVTSDTTGKQSECYHASRSTQTESALGGYGSNSYAIFGVCKAFNMEYGEYQGLLLGLSYDKGAVRLAKFLPRDYVASLANRAGTFGGVNTPFFVQQDANAKLIIGMSYTDGSSNNIAIIRTDVTGFKYNYLYFNQNAPSGSITTDMVADPSLTMFFAFTHSTNKEQIFAFRTTDSATQLIGTSGEDYYIQSTFTGQYSKTTPFWLSGSYILVPYVLSSSNLLEIYIFNKALGVYDEQAFYFSNTAFTITSVAGAESTSTSGTLYYQFLITATDRFIFFALSTSLSTVVTYRTWEFSNTGAYYMTGAAQFFSADSVVFAATGKWTSSATYTSSIIFRFDSINDNLVANEDINDFSCVAFRDVIYSEYFSGESYFYETQSSLGFSGTSDMGSTTLYYEQAIYNQEEFITEANSINILTYSYSNPYEWGYNLIPDHYDFRIPQLKMQCGAYSRQNTYKYSASGFQRNTQFGTFGNGPDALTYNTDYGTYYADITQGQVGYYTLTGPDPVCQNRPLQILVFSSGNTSLAIEQSWITFSNNVLTINAGQTTQAQTALSTSSPYSAISGHLYRRNLMGGSTTIAQPGTYGLIVRYSDTTDPTTYYDHPLIIRVFAQSDTRPLDALVEGADCYQNPYPTSFGGCSSSESPGLCKMQVYAFVPSFTYDGATGVTMADLYIGGSIQQDASFMQYPFLNSDDAYILHINDLAMPQWFTTFSISRTYPDAITAITLTSRGYLYAFMTTMESDYSIRQSAILKVRSKDGMLVEQMSVNLYNYNQGAFYFGDVRSMQTLSSTGYFSNKNAFLMSFPYATDQGSDQRVGTIAIYDQNNDDTTTNTWSVNEFYSLQEQSDYDYVVGSYQFVGTVASPNAYWEAHLAQPPSVSGNTFFSSPSRSYFYLLQFDQSQTNRAKYQQGLRTLVYGTVSSSNTYTPKLLQDNSQNLYAAFLTSSNAYLMKYNLTASPTTFALYTFNQLSSSITSSSFQNIDFVYIPTPDIFIIIVNVVNGVLYFFSLDRLTMTVTANTLIRNDQITSGYTYGDIAFYSTGDYFTYVRNVPTFANTGTNEVFVSRKAYLFSQDNEFDCAASGFLSTSGLSVGLALDAYINDGSSVCSYPYSGVANSISYEYSYYGYQYLCTWPIVNVVGADQFLYFTYDAYYVTAASSIFRHTPYVSSYYMPKNEIVDIFPQQETSIAGQYGVGTESCSMGTGVQRPTTIDLPIIAQQIGTTASTTYTSSSFLQCQAQQVQFSFYYEDGTQTQSSENIFATYDSTLNKLTYDLSDYRPAPGMRLFQFKANTLNDKREDFITQPFVIQPEGYSALTDNAPTSVTLPFSCVSDNEYPKIVGDIQNNFTQYGSDIHAASGNILICGSAESGAFPNSFWTESTPVAVNMMASLEGQIYWSYAVSYIPNTNNKNQPQTLSYRECSIADTSSVYSLLLIQENGQLVMVKQSFGYGQYIYAKQIPGAYTGSFFGFSLIEYDPDSNPLTANSELYGYVFGDRTDIAVTNSVHEFSKFYLQDASYPYQVWNAYTTISSLSGVTTPSIQLMGASQDAVYTLSHFAIASAGPTYSYYANIVKHDAESGEQLQSMAYPATLQNPQLDFVVDYPNQLVYLAAATVVTSTGPTLQYRTFIRRFDLDLVPDDSVVLYVSFDSTVYPYAQEQFVTSMAYDPTYLYETFSFFPDTYYIVVYLRQTLDIQTYIQFYSSQIQIHNLNLNYFADGTNNWLIHQSTSSGYFVSGHKSAVLSRFTYTNLELNDPNICLDNYYTDLVSTVTANAADNVTDSTANVDISSGISYYFTPSYYKLQPQQFLYFEQKLWPEQISFQSAMNFECATPGLTFPEALEHQIINLPMNREEDRVYSFYLPDVCDINSLMVTMSVDGYAALPSFLSGSIQTTPEGNFYRVVFNESLISDTNAGIYNIKIYMQLNSATATGYFILSIYPEVEYGSNVDSFECVDKYNFMSYGGVPGTLFTDFDLDVQTQDYVICGANMLSTNVHAGDYSAFVQYNTQGHAIKWHLNLQSGPYNNIAQFCEITDPFTTGPFMGEKLVYTVVNSENFIQTSSVFNSSIYIFQHGQHAEFVNAKQIRNQDSDGTEFLLQAEGFVVGGDGSLYVSGTVDGYTLSHNSPGFFIVKLDSSLTLIFYSVFDFGKIPSGGELLLANSNLYAIFGYQSDVTSSLLWGLVAVDRTYGEVVPSTTAGRNLAVTLANGTEITRNNTRGFYQQGLEIDNAGTYLYSCLIYKASMIHDEIALTQHTASTLMPAANLEFSRGYVPLEACHLQFQESTQDLVMAIGTFEYTHLFGFNVQVPGSIQNITYLGLAYYHQRYVPFKIQLIETVYLTAPANNFFSLYIRTMGFDNNDDKLFITKFSDIATPKWDDPCVASEIQFDTTSTFYLSFNTPNGVGVNDESKWSNISFAFKQVSNLTIDNFYLGNPQSFAETIASAQNYIYRASFLNCSRYSFPTLPETIISENSAILDVNASVSVRDASYVLTFNPFMSCSYDSIIHDIVYQDDSAIADYLVFDSTALTLTIKATVNDYVGVYLLRYRAYVAGSPQFLTYYDFELTITTNYPPYPVLNGFTDDYVLYSGHTKVWDVLFDFDQEGDTAIFNAILLDISGTEIIDPTWFEIVSNNNTALVFTASDPPITDTTNGDQYYINVTISDSHNINDPRVYQISLLVAPNTAPVLDGNKQSLDLGVSYAAVAFSFSLYNDDFIDYQGDTPIYSCDILTTSTKGSAWLKLTTTTTSLTFSGIPPSNLYNGKYSFVCAVTDEYLPTINFYQFSVTIANNMPVNTYDISTTILTETDFHVWADIITACIDPEDQPIIRTLSYSYNSSTPFVTIPSKVLTHGFYWDPSIPYLSFALNDNNDPANPLVGRYSLQMTCSDNFNTPNPSVNFKLYTYYNDPPEAQMYTDPTDSPLYNLNHVVTVSTPIVFQIDISDMFSDPEDEELYFEVLQQITPVTVPATYGAVDPTSLTASIQDGMLKIVILAYTTPKTYNLEIVATDPLGQSVSVGFPVVIFGCDPSCGTCFGALANQCLTCNNVAPSTLTKYVVHASTCVASCTTQLGTYLNTGNSSCNDCPTGCTTCTGPNANTQCSVCEANYYLFTNTTTLTTGCFAFCPIGYKIDSTGTHCVTETTQLYKDCIKFIGNFTHWVTNSYVESFSAMALDSTASGVVSCMSSSGATVTWTRQFAVQCRETNEATPSVFIQVATNSLPPHCVSADATSEPIAEEINFEVKFSPATSALTKKALSTLTAVNSAQCSSLAWTAVSTLTQAAYGYSGTGHTTVVPSVPTGIVGVAVNGVPIHAGTSEYLQDFGYPKSTGPIHPISVDECIGSLGFTSASFANDNFYRYYSFSPCLYDSSLYTKSSLQDCLSITSCKDDYLKYASLHFPTALRLRNNFVGLALDGHMIMGPYRLDGILFQPCDVDICNGLTVNGHYVYASTMFYPYTVGCYGPGSGQTQFAPSCSSNTNVCLTTSYSFFGLAFNMMAILFITFLMFN